MAKQATAKKVEVAPQEFKEPSKMVNTQGVKKPKWEIKDRIYLLQDRYKPLTYTMQSKHHHRSPLLWFEPETSTQRELRFAINQNSPFVDEQKGEVTLGHIMFLNGELKVSKEQQNLQKLLSLYHPGLNKKYYEFNPIAIATHELDYLELEVDAMVAARSMDIDQMEAILRVEVGSEVKNMKSKEIKRDLMVFAKENPSLFLDLASDENVMLRNFAITATESGIIKLLDDQRTFVWASNNKKFMTVPFDEHPYSAMAAFFKTDEGLEIYKSIEKKFS
tara:strand:+ start:220 stop:1050 length:831 start_codon:yes stop_codon:yes gene_type:complete